MTTHLTKQGRHFVLRQPTVNDAAGILRFATTLFAATDQVLTTPEEYTITLEQERQWINSFLENPNALILIAELDGETIGLLTFTAHPKKKMAHTGEFGISVHPHHQGKGIGKKMIEHLLLWAKDHPQIEKVNLGVFASNQAAIDLYKKCGFKEEGRQLKAIKQPSGEYTDLVLMSIETV
jgi:RimJ/RimL family protein N-acetyltransferase